MSYKLQYSTKIDERLNIFNDGIGFVELWDFSKGNLNEESRVEIVSLVASICYENPNAVGKESLYNRLASESMGLPSSSFEFIPVLLNMDRLKAVKLQYQYVNSHSIPRVVKYGEILKVDGIRYLITNYRALLYDYEFLCTEGAYLLSANENITKWFNTEEECSILRKYVPTFLHMIDKATSAQNNRHRQILQELSRRYVSGKKLKFSFLVTEGLGKVKSNWQFTELEEGHNPYQVITTQALIDMCVNHYYAALEQGVQPQEARRILPQSMYTKTWHAGLPFSWLNYFNLRMDGHAQEEIRILATNMRDMFDKHEYSF